MSEHMLVFGLLSALCAGLFAAAYDSVKRAEGSNGPPERNWGEPQVSRPRTFREACEDWMTAVIILAFSPVVILIALLKIALALLIPALILAVLLGPFFIIYLVIQAAV